MFLCNVFLSLTPFSSIFLLAFSSFPSFFFVELQFYSLLSIVVGKPHFSRRNSLYTQMIAHTLHMRTHKSIYSQPIFAITKCARGKHANQINYSIISQLSAGERMLVPLIYEYIVHCYRIGENIRLKNNHFILRLNEFPTRSRNKMHSK